MGITSDNFDLNQPSNLANCKFFLSSLMRYSDLSQVDCVVHKALELYAFIAITGSRSTLESLIQTLRRITIYGRTSWTVKVNIWHGV